MFNRASQPILLVCPALLFVLLLALYPLAQVLVLSLRPGDLQPGNGLSLGFANYIRLLRDGAFWGALQHTFVYVAGSTALHILLGAVLGLLCFLLQDFRGISFVRTLIILPWAVTPAVAAALWRLIYHPELSVIPKVLDQLGLHVAWDWLGNTRLALWAVLAANVWLFTPFYMLMTLARLQATPLELLDAAAVDGATWWQTVFHILVPSVRPLLFTLMAFDVTGTFIQFDMVWVMTGGGPLGSTEVLSTYVYRLAFDSFDFGMASAAGIVLLILLAACSRLLLSKAEGQIL